MTSKTNASHVADLTKVIDTLTAERNSLLGITANRVAQKAKRAAKVSQRPVYGGRTAQILARPNMAAKELAALIGTHPRYVYKIRQANAA
jgi:hypothetical protein